MQLDRIAVVVPYLKGQDVNLRSGAKWLLKRLENPGPKGRVELLVLLELFVLCKGIC